MTERRTRERRKHARGSRVDVTRDEYEQLRGVVTHLVETVQRDLRSQAARTTKLQTEIDRLTGMIAGGFRKRHG